MKTTARQPFATRRLLFAAVLGALTLFAVGAREAAAAPSASLNPTAGCDLAVINDWSDNNRVDHTYAIPCYTQAIQRLNSYPDLKGYSSAEDDIRNALLAAIRQDRGSGPTNTTGGGPSPNNNGPGTTNSSGTSHKGFVTRLADRLGPGNAQSIPLPLLVLGGLALLLLLSAAGTWIARRLQARRMTPAPAPARRP